MRLILASTCWAAALATLGAAPCAASEPAKGASPAVKACPALGPGFYQLPGSDTCVRIGGRARYDFQMAGGKDRATATTGSRAVGAVSMDTRTQTEAGPLRAYVRVGVSRSLGAIPAGLSSR